ncbi:CaiB/BaiF CoA transferase family protein [Frondihabitans australicus]|uniref:Formyl-CoA transferase n=1 Tax=Frondihabitans australicus TaxID=386892 RepID=A0A495IID7_9MICO|nr:CaiB/BaiF CoA-transferase family protein [Frondihabitans australicus]RKR75061.1 formyl-CoA transferase [Frondihabitans australicus]
MTAPRTQPLEGVRMLELGNFIAAPTAGRLLADFGADVIKIERPHTGDELRTWRLHRGTTSLLYRTINRNKRSVVADLRSDAGRQLVLDLLPEVDVVLENFRPGTLERWGLSPEVMDAANPRLVVVRISAFGQTGPQSSQPGFGAIAEAVGGLRELTGDPDRAPVRMGISIADSIAGLYSAFGAVLSLYDLVARERRGDAPAPLADRTVDVALSESVLSMMESLVPDHEAFGVNRTRTGGRIEGIAPTNAYLCEDGRSVVIAGNGDGIYTRFMGVIGRPDLATRRDLGDNRLRWAHRDELDDAITAWTSSHTVDQVLAALDAAGVPAGAIYTAADIAADEQYAARGMIQRRDVSIGDETLHDIGFPGIVPQIGNAPRDIRRLGPDLGEDTREVLSELLHRPADEIEAYLDETQGAVRA